MPYLCYDLKAIQAFIFRIPKLKYIIGGSAIIDQFDRDIAPLHAQKVGADPVSCGGGKGGFYCPDDSIAAKLEKALVDAAHSEGLDVRIGIDADYSNASTTANRLYSFVPEMTDDHPCRISGLYPTADEDGHPIVQRRVTTDHVRKYERRLSELLGLKLLADMPNAEFLRSVDPDDADGSGAAGFRSIGGIRRWAVICMDGNDMGLQFRAMKGRNPDEIRRWVQAMSRALDHTAQHSCAAGMCAVLNRWKRDQDVSESTYRDRDELRTVLPLRPLIVGGDDIAVICHAAYAFDFVKAAMEAWTSVSSERASSSEFKAGLWPATGGRLTVSAGVFFCPSSMPLYAAVSYAELLQASAKRKGREISNNPPTPCCLDWESATESMLDTPIARRRRELEFVDEDINKNVKLTERPYSLHEFKSLEALRDQLGRDIPVSVRHEILPGLRQGAHDRTLFRYRIMKSYRELGSRLDESATDSWWTQTDKGLSTGLIDALSLLEEEARSEENR